ncbi:fibronectin type III domain-containing protein, partial [Aequorivita sp. CIP111184]|uniref:fibronectin type III domain-containing protein n=1 Tax=Aequorivita sp. CIP111184 TaxID=2211356 RepID=UPI0011BEB7E4
MKTKIFLALFFAINLLSCSKDSGDDENTTFTFQVEVQNVTDRAATITWTRPEGSNISYQIFLNNEMIEDNFGLTAYTFSGLSSETTYNGKITATDGNQIATVEYFFNTNEYLANTNNSNVYLYTQEQVNEFGTHHYNELLYNLTVVGSEIYDLSPLIDLKKVHGYFELGHTQAQTFEGLNNLEFVGNNLKIYYNREVKNLNSLQSLNHIGGDLIFYSNLVLEDINGLQNLRDFEGGFQLEGSKITDLNILNDSVKLKNLYIAYNTELKTIEGFQSLTEIEEFLDIDYN